MDRIHSNTFTVMIEPFQGCNLRCSYCYSDTSPGTAMSQEVLRVSLEKTVRYAEEHGFGEMHYLWHGGEPLVAGLDFFRAATEILKNLAPEIPSLHFIQTNGLLLDDEYCRFFRDRNFQLGISLDGPAEVHNTNRLDHSGRTTHEAVLEKVQLLEKHRLPVGFNAVISRASVACVRRVYHFFRDLGYGFRINPIIPGQDPRKTRKLLLHEGEYGDFLEAMFRVWTESETDRVRISPLDSYLRAILDGELMECQQQPTCVGSHLAIKSTGKAVLCSRFEGHILGDVRELTIGEILSSLLCEQIRRRTEGLGECHACINWAICHGGCPHNNIAFQRNLKEKDPLCKDYQKIFAHIRRAIQPIIEADLKEQLP